MASMVCMVLGRHQPGPGFWFADVDPETWLVPYVELPTSLVSPGAAQPIPCRSVRTRMTRAQMTTFLAEAFDVDQAPTAGFMRLRESVGSGGGVRSCGVRGVRVLWIG